MSSPVSINILGKEYQISCPDDEKEALIASAQLLHGNMEKIRGTGKVVGLDRIAVMAALNLANELINLQNDGGGDLSEMNKQIIQIKEKVNDFLDEDRQMEL
ncbi:MAG: cell division protein ZapA [Methylophaga sp.]|nr:MAG: cell division protein ZapA [Methylophaga sp.]